jgi:hypothetical protein
MRVNATPARCSLLGGLTPRHAVPLRGGIRRYWRQPSLIRNLVKQPRGGTLKTTIGVMSALLLSIGVLGVNREQVADPPPTTETTTTTTTGGHPTSVPPSPDPNRRVNKSPAPETTAPTTTTTTTTTEPPQPPPQATLTAAKPGPASQCPQWHTAALSAGWDADLLERLDRIMWRESRCEPHVHNTKDPHSGSRGLTQINGYWCRRNSLNPHPAGWLGAEGVVTHCDDLFDVDINLRAAKAIYDYGVNRHRCGWGPWSTKGSNWCTKR